MSEYTMYIIINNDINMTKGKIASQVGHAVQDIIENLLDSYYVSKKCTEKYNNYKKWKTGCKKIILKANHNDLINLIKNYDCVPIYDAGKTQIEPNSLTCIAFYPSNTNYKLFTNYKLL
jgi:PTH2 family peptidyl-tRNA hydrolase